MLSTLFLNMKVQMLTYLKSMHGKVESFVSLCLQSKIDIQCRSSLTVCLALCLYCQYCGSLGSVVAIIDLDR